MRANAPDGIKAYVELGFGIAVLPAVAYDRRQDPGLRAIEASHLFGSGILAIALDHLASPGNFPGLSVSNTRG